MDVTALTDQDRIDLLAEVVASIEQVCSTIEDHQWDLPTDLPGWTVKDNLSHLASFEATAVGRPRADQSVDVSGYDYVKNDFQAINEREVEVRRARPGAEVLAEFREVTTLRLQQLPTLDQSQDIPADATPLGFTMPMRDFLLIRLSDLLYHEQDIRRAVGTPGGLDGRAAATVFERMVQLALPRVVGKAAAAPEGSTVAFHVDGGRSFAIAVRQGRGAVEDVPAEPTVRFTTDLEAFLCLMGGRWTGERAIGDGRLKLEGDEELAKRVLANITVVP